MHSDELKEFIEEEMTPYLVSELMCVGCQKRWIDVHPEQVWLKDLECPHCGKKGLIISTGQIIDEDMVPDQVTDRVPPQIQ